MQIIAMDESALPVPQSSDYLTNGVDGLFHDYQTIADSSSLCSAVKCCLIKYAINGADMVFLDQKLSKRSSLTNGIQQPAAFSGNPRRSCSKASLVHGEPDKFEPRRGKENNVTSMRKEKARRNTDPDVLELISSDSLSGTSDEWKTEYVDESSGEVNSPSRSHNDFPFNFLAFFAVLLMKFMGFQFNLLVSFFTFPIWLSYISFMFLIFPLQTLRHIRRYLMKKLLGWWCISSQRVAVKTQKSVASLAFRFGCAFFWSSYVCLMLLGLLASGFVFGGLAMRQLLVKPIHTSETLNFDYTKASPVAFVPIMPLSGMDNPSGLIDKDIINAEVSEHKQLGARVIPYNHHLQPTVSLVMPESDYNRKLGIFQIRLELVSARGKVTGSSSHPCILRFKSQPIRLVESIIRSVPIIAGLQSSESESQTLKVKMDEFREGLEPTAFLKVVIEQRAEFKAGGGGGVPEIYAASVLLESQLPHLKRLVWLWRRTALVWISIVLFLAELTLALVFCPNLVMPRGKPSAATTSLVRIMKYAKK